MSSAPELACRRRRDASPSALASRMPVLRETCFPGMKLKACPSPPGERHQPGEKSSGLLGPTVTQARVKLRGPTCAPASARNTAGATLKAKLTGQCARANHGQAPAGGVRTSISRPRDHACGYASLPISSASRPDHSTSASTRLPMRRSMMTKNAKPSPNTTSRLVATPTSCATSCPPSP